MSIFPNNAEEKRAVVRRLWIAALATIAYFLWFAGLVGLRSEHIALYFAVLGAYLANDKTRDWLYVFSALILFWMLYDSLRICPNYKVNAVHIEDLYNFDKKWFGLDTPNGRITLNEYWAVHTSKWLDIVSAMFYLSWVPVPMLFGIWMLRHDRSLFIEFTYGYLFTNLVGFTLYYIYPAAPPWYVEMHGFVFHENTPRSTAGLDSFDQMIGWPLFKTIYARNSNVFAAIPSLHSAYPLLTLFYARRMPQRWPTVLFVVLCLGIWCSAIYLRHHYILDVLLGMLTAVAGYWIAVRYMRKRG
jgi:inositol phosphorylceramide synthase catalytic subunit